mmetsp:Transcript_130609/g.418038  ORF Transcript_130609/g.418038 Transcript_130609/m.418038 type:complete len:309 (+) Transcript_130609:603-1529(+)
MAAMSPLEGRADIGFEAPEVPLLDGGPARTKPSGRSVLFAAVSASAGCLEPDLPEGSWCLPACCPSELLRLLCAFVRLCCLGPPSELLDEPPSDPRSFLFQFPPCRVSREFFGSGGGGGGGMRGCAGFVLPDGVLSSGGGGGRANLGFTECCTPGPGGAGGRGNAGRAASTSERCQSGSDGSTDDRGPARPSTMRNAAGLPPDLSPNCCNCAWAGFNEGGGGGRGIGGASFERGLSEAAVGKRIERGPSGAVVGFILDHSCAQSQKCWSACTSPGSHKSMTGTRSADAGSNSSKRAGLPSRGGGPLVS